MEFPIKLEAGCAPPRDLNSAIPEALTMIRFLKWAFGIGIAGLIVALLFLIITLQKARCDEIGNVEMPECVLDD